MTGETPNTNEKVVENKDLVDKKAIENITKANPNVVDKAVKNNASLNTAKNILDNQTKNNKTDIVDVKVDNTLIQQEAIKAQQENIVLMEQMKTIVDKDLVNERGIATPQFRNIVNFFAYFEQWPQDGTSIHAPIPGTFITTNSTIDTNLDQKRDIKKAFLSIPSNILKACLIQYNVNHKKTPLNIPSIDNTEYQNIQNKITQNNIIIANYNDFIKKEGDKTLTLADYEASQIVGEVFELPLEEQKKIQDKLSDIKKSYDTYSITSINLKGYADATPVTPQGKVNIENGFTQNMKALNDNGLNITGLPKDYASFGQWLVDNKTWINTQVDPTKNETITDDIIKNPDLIANRAFAFTRSIMQVSRMSKEEVVAKNLDKSKLKLELKVSKIKGDIETRGGIDFSGTGSYGQEKKIFTMSNEKPEVVIKNTINIGVKFTDKSGKDITKIFSFEKKDNIKPNGKVKNISTSGMVINEGNLGTQGVPKNQLSWMKTSGDVTYYSTGDFGGPYFYMNIQTPPSSETNPKERATYDKITNSELNNPETAPSVDDMLDLYKYLMTKDQEAGKGPKKETDEAAEIEKFKTMF